MGCLCVGPTLLVRVDLRKQILDADEAFYFDRSLAEGEADDLTVLQEVSTESIAQVSRHSSNAPNHDEYIFLLEWMAY